MIPSGGYLIVDVRDVAKVHAAVMEPGRGPRRYLAGGTFLRFADLIAGWGR
jgi:dihydroflavonol-4-reductase